MRLYKIVAWFLAPGVNPLQLKEYVLAKGCRHMNVVCGGDPENIWVGPMKVAQDKCAMVRREYPGAQTILAESVDPGEPGHPGQAVPKKARPIKLGGFFGSGLTRREATEQGLYTPLARPLDTRAVIGSIPSSLSIVNAIDLLEPRKD